MYYRALNDPMSPPLTDRLEALGQISRLVSSTLDVRTLYDTIYEQVGTLMDTTIFYIALDRPDRKTIEVPYMREHGNRISDMEVTWSNSITGHVIEHGVQLLFHTPDEYATYAKAHGLPELIVGDEDSESQIFVPLNTGSRTLGVLSVQSIRRRAYTTDDVETLGVIASQAAVAIENARLYDQSRKAASQMRVLLHVAQMVNASLDLTTVLDAILSGMREVIPYYFAAILLPDHERQQLDVAATIGSLDEKRWDRVKIPFGRGVTGVTFASGTPLNVPDVRAFPEYIDHGIDEVLSELAIPLKRGQTVVGVLDVEREEVNAFSDDEMNLLSLFASQAAIAIENARLYSEQQERAFELQTIQRIVQKITPLHDIQFIASIIHDELKSLIDYHSCRLFVLDADTEILRVVSDTSPESAELSVRVGEGVTGSVAASRVSEYIANSLEHPSALPIAGTPRRAESILAAPLTCEGRVLGVVTLSKLGANQFDENAMRLLEIVAAQTALAFDRVRLYAQLRQQAITDELTGIYNRRYLTERFHEERARSHRNHHPLAVLMVDIDKFKKINDTYGHSAGDMVLKELALMIRSVVRAEDVVARYGGEEFCVLLPEIPLPRVVKVAERLRVMIEEHELPVQAGAGTLTVSLGLAMLQPEDDDSDVFIRADDAMYTAKRAGGNRIGVTDGGDISIISDTDVPETT